MAFVSINLWPLNIFLDAQSWESWVPESDCQTILWGESLRLISVSNRFSFLLSWVFQVHFNNRLTRDFTLKQGSEKYFIEKIDLVLYQQSFLSHKTTLNKHNIIINMLALVAISGTLAHHILASNCLYCDQLEGDNIKIMTSWQ